MSLKNISNELLDNMPSPQEHAIEQETGNGVPGSDNTPGDGQIKGVVADGPRDVDGNSFDPKIHEVDKDGKPKLSPKRGKLIKKRIRKSRAKSVLGAGPEIDKPIPGSSQDCRMAAQATVDSISAIGQLIGGQEWAFIRSEEHGIDERMTGVDAFAKYYESKDIRDVPPGLAITIWTLGYVIPRFRMPVTQTRTQLAWAWIKSKWPRRNKHPDPETLEA